MVALRDLFVKLIHSQGIADHMGTNLRASLIGCYESHWSRSIEYCLRKHLNVFEVDCQSFSKYLLYLFQVDRYVPSTIISHRTSIASVLQHWKYEPANDPCIRGIFAPKFSVGPTSPMKNYATMELSSHPVSPVMTSLFPWCSLWTQRWRHWPKVVDAQYNIFVAGYCQEEILSACFMCVNLPLHMWRCAESVGCQSLTTYCFTG